MEYVYFEPPSLQKKRGLEWSQLKVVACKNWPLEKITIILLRVVAYENF